MRLLITIMITGLLLFSLVPQSSFSQNSKVKHKTSNNQKSVAKKLSKQDIFNNINKNTKSFKKNLRGNWILEEDFESGNFPPTDWTVTIGTSEWMQSGYSGYGLGIYSMFYSSWNCDYSNNTIYTSSFPLTQSGDKLIFDYAYAPWNDGVTTYYDSLEIFYFNDNDATWYSLVLYNGTDLQTALETNNYYYPQSNEWGTKTVDIPAGASQLYFQFLEGCSNTLYIDNIKVGTLSALLSEDFESGIFPPDGWSNPGAGSIMWAGSPYSAFGNGDYSAIYDFYGCEGGSDDSLVSPIFSPTGGSNYLSFDYAYTPYDTFDVDNLEIFYSTDQGSSYSSLVYYTGFDLQTTPYAQIPYLPQNNEWQTKSILLPIGTNRISFNSINGCGNNLYVDNITVDAPVNPAGDASVEFVWAKGKLPLVFGVPDKIPVLIKNNGASNISNLKVYLNISGANNLSDSLVIPSIGAGDTMQVEFLGFSPVLSGFSDVTVSVPNDDNNGNNSKTFLSEVNPSTIRYVDSNCCNSGVGWVGEYSFLNKHYMSGTGLIGKVNIKIGQNNQDQFVYGYVVSNSGIVLGKSPHYKIKATDGGKYVSFNITDPKPPIVTNDYYYVGIAQTEFAGDGFAFTPQELQYEVPARPDANYFASLSPPGAQVYVGEFPREYGQNYAIEAVIGDQLLIDNGISNPGLIYDQYFTNTVHTAVVKVFNAGTALTSFNIRRTITPGGYTSTKTVSGLVSGGNANVTFDPWTFTSGTTYTIRDSILTFDGNTSNNQMTSTITPRIAKQMCVLWQQQTDRDSIVRSIISDGRYANNFDTVRMNYTGSYRPWKIMIVALKEEKSYSPWVRDSMKSFIDNSTAGNKKTLVLFSDAVANPNDPVTGYPTPADSVFYRQYLKAKTISDDWMGSIPASQDRFRGIGFFDGITQDSVSDPYTPELIKPTNGSSAAFKPQSVTGNGADSCIAVSFAGANYNTFFMTNQFSSLRATNSSPDSPLGPVRVYTKIIDWIQSSNTGAKVLDLTAQIEGFYDPGSNSMATDTMRVKLRSFVSPYPVVDSAKAVLNAAGQASFVFNNASNGVGYYIQLKHRNGLETWSKTPQSFSSNHLAYNFTTNADKAYGDNMKLSGSKWVVYAGDADQNGTIDLFDLVLIYNQSVAFLNGYAVTDVNGDNVTDLTDVILCYNNSVAFVVKSIPTSDQFANPVLVQDKISGSNNNGEEMNEIKVDAEIYERYKNEQSKQAITPDIYFQEKGKSNSIIKGKEFRK